MADMPDGYYDDDEDYDADDSRGGGDESPDLVRDLRRQLKQALKDKKNYEGELSRLRRAERERSLSGTLESKGYSPKIAKLIPSDVADDDEALTQWLDEFGDVFGGRAEPQAPSDTDEGNRQAVDAGAVERQRMSALAETGSTPAGGFASFEERMARAQSQDEIAQILAEAKQFIS